MTYDYGTSSPGTGTPSNGAWPADDQPTTQLPSVPSSSTDVGSSGGGQTADVAKDEALGVASSAKEKGSNLLEEGVDKARSVAGEAGHQARDLMDQARVELTAQAYDQQQRVAGGLRTFGQELSSMAESSSEGGFAADLARQVASHSTNLAQWLDDREPGGVLEEVKDFARRRPGAFLAIAAGAGVLAGRLTRGLKDADEPSTGSPSTTGRTSPSHRAATPERLTAWPPTGVQQEGTGYGQGSGGYAGTTGYAGGGYAGGDYAGTGNQGTAAGGYAAPGLDDSAVDHRAYDDRSFGEGTDDEAGYGTGSDRTADPLDTPLRPDPATDPTRQPRNEEGWR